MPPIAWSSSGELVAYTDINRLRNGSSFAPGQVLPPTVVKNLRRGYYAAVSHMDDQIGLVMAALAATGFADTTIVSFWGDHGWQLGEHGEWCKHTNFELATRAPMMIRVPGLTDGPRGWGAGAGVDGARTGGAPSGARAAHLVVYRAC
jgi:iduronate 2-sulfatase